MWWGIALLVLAGCAPAGPKEVHIDVTDDGFVPAKVTLARGETAILVMTRKVDGTCADEAIFAETGRKYDLPLNQPVRIEIDTERAVTYHFTCPMEMYHGEIDVK